jgi:hypothetical protein
MKLSKYIEEAMMLHSPTLSSATKKIASKNTSKSKHRKKKSSFGSKIIRVLRGESDNGYKVEYCDKSKKYNVMKDSCDTKTFDSYDEACQYIQNN